MDKEYKKSVLRGLVKNCGKGGAGYKSSDKLRSTAYYKRMKALKKISKLPDSPYTQKLKDIDSFRRTRKIVGI